MWINTSTRMSIMKWLFLVGWKTSNIKINVDYIQKFECTKKNTLEDSDCTSNFKIYNWYHRKLLIPKPNFGLLIEVATSEILEEIEDWQYVRMLCNKQIRLLSSFDFEWLFGHVRVICKLGAGLAHNRPQKQSCRKFEGVFGVVRIAAGRVFGLFQNR